MLSQKDNELMTRVGAGTPMGEMLRRYWVPACFSNQIAEPDSAPVRVKLFGEPLVAFRDSKGRVGLLDERCPHRTASLFFGRNEECGLRCVYHGIKFDIEGNCVDLPGVEPTGQIWKSMKAKSYPCVERGEVVWTYMGPAEHKPEFPDFEWTMVPKAHRFATRHHQECNWLQALDGGFDASHLTFLHSGAVDLRKGGHDKDRRIVPSIYEAIPSGAGFIAGSGRVREDGSVAWHVEHMLVPFHKLIPSVVLGAHVWAPMDDENTMLYSINFNPHRPLTDEEMEREYSWRGIHTENMPGSDRAFLNKDNDYGIDRALQKSGRSFTGIKGLGIQDCAMQESMGPIADRTLEHLLPGDLPIVRIRRLLRQTVNDHQAGKPLPGMDPKDYRVRPVRFDGPKGVPFADLVMNHIQIDTPAAAE
jgi:phthalate 4,5-dioxygenase oxygenase subunit